MNRIIPTLISLFSSYLFGRQTYKQNLNAYSMARKEGLDLLLECRQIELEFCNMDSRMHGVILKEIKYLKKRVAEQAEAEQAEQLGIPL